MAPTPEESLVQILQESDWPNALTYAKQNKCVISLVRKTGEKKNKTYFQRTRWNTESTYRNGFKNTVFYFFSFLARPAN